MSKAARAENVLEWTFSEAPAAGEVSWPAELLAPQRRAATPAPASKRRWHGWLWPCALVVFALAATAALPYCQAWLMRRAVENLVERQEAARLAGDWETLRLTFADPAGDWAAVQVARLRGSWQAAAFGLPGARLAGQAGRVTNYQLIEPRLARVDVVRAFILSDGTPAEFALPQFYWFSSGAWRQLPAPRVAGGDQQALPAARVYVYYTPADAEWAASLAGDLDRLLARACADWDCPADLRLPLIFGAPDPAPDVSSTRAEALPGSLTYHMLAAGQPRLPGLAVYLPTRAWAGYPADAAALAAVRRVVAVEALANIAERLSGGQPAAARPVKPLLYALVVRELARLGVEPDSLLNWPLALTSNDANGLWSAAATAPGAWRELPQALALLDGVLADRPLSDERRLLQRLPSAPDLVSWVADGLALTPEQAHDRLAHLGPG